MNSQRKQSSNKSGAIKTDKYGVPLNYGNYKNGRLVTKKKKPPSNNSRSNNDSKKKSDTGRGGGGGNNSNNNAKSQKQSARNTQKNEERQGKKLSLASTASVGLTRDAHDVIKEALLVSSSSTSNLAALEEDATNNNNSDTTQSQQPTQRTKQQSANNNKRNNNNRNRRSVPDLAPPPIIRVGNDPMDMGPMGKQRRALPVYNFKDELLETIANNRVTVVEGETGESNVIYIYIMLIVSLLVYFYAL